MRRERRTYNSWKAMMYRCYVKESDSYYLYGARGIRVCRRWRKWGGEGFRNFVAGMGERPLGRTLDRRDNNGNYTPKNCRWATPLQQANNNRNAKFITINGERRHLRGWSKVIGVQASVFDILSRYHGVSVRDVIVKKLSMRGKPKGAHMWSRA